MDVNRLSLDGATPSISTDFLDYLPGSTATITVSDFILGSTIEFQVFHVLHAGADGVYGTLDDTIEEAANPARACHKVWHIADGVRSAGAAASWAMPMEMAISTGSR